MIFRCGPMMANVFASEEVFIDLKRLFYWDTESVNDAASWRVNAITRSKDLREKEIYIEELEFDEMLNVYCDTPRLVKLPSGGVVEVDDEARVITIWNNEHKGLVNDCYRVVRQIMISEAFARDYCCLHAGTVVSPNGAVLFFGDKGAGKTTMTSQIAAKYGWPLLSNDKVFISTGGDVCHFPEAPGITVNSIRNRPDWNKHWDRMSGLQSPASEIFRDHPKLLKSSEIQNSHSDHKVFLSEIEYLEFLGVTGVCSAPAAVAVVLSKSQGEASVAFDADKVNLSEHIDHLEPFHDWLKIRSTAPVSTSYTGWKRIIDYKRSNNIDEALETLGGLLVGH